VSKAIYNIYFHPLSSYPGPKLWTLTRLPFVISLARGDLHLRLKSFHDQYGRVVRIAPNELSYIDGAAWEDIYTGHVRNKGLPKNSVVFGAQQFRSILDGSDDDHTRMRKVLAHSFSNQVLYRQEGLLHFYVAKLLDRLHTVARAGKAVNIVEWYNYLSFDVTGELAFSEPFDQLEHRLYHPWVKMIVSHLKYSALSICFRFFQPLDKLMPFITPPSLRRLKWSFVSMSRQKVFRRLARPDSKQLDDILGACLQDGKPSGMSIEELVGTFTFLIVAGSETTATVLAGVTNYLCNNARALQLLKDELRSFQDENAFTIASTATLPYLNAVLKEGMRLCYPIPVALTRIVPEGGKMICGRFVPGNVSFLSSPFSIARQKHR
jgi:cytochrome P450